MIFKKCAGRLQNFFGFGEAVEEESTKIRVFKKEGESPLSDIDFEAKDVFEMNGEAFQTEEKAMYLYENIFELPYTFELYFIPTVINFEEELAGGRIEEEYEEYIARLKEVLPETEYNYKRVFLITMKEESKQVVTDLQKLSFNMMGAITKEEAEEIVVR